MIPTTIQVGPFCYSVVVNEDAINKASIDFGHHLCGSSDHCFQVITVSPNLAADMTAEVLLHETLHAIDHSSGMAKLKEAQVAQLATSLLDTLRRNPELVAFLMGEAKEKAG